jgi:hypothetical protein
VKYPTTTITTTIIIPTTSSISRVITYPTSYILTDVPPPPLSSLDINRSPIICPPTKSWRVPDPYDCTIYHDCYHGTDLVSYCPTQFQYNPVKRSCDHAQNVQCKNL